LESVDGLDPAPGEGFASVGEHPQGFELPVESQHTQGLGADRDRGHCMSVVGVCLAVVAGVEQPDTGSELGWDVDDPLAVFEESLRKRPAGSVASLNSPDPLRPGPDVLAHRSVADAVGGEPSRTQQLFLLVDDLDGGRQLVGIDPDDDLLHVLLPPVLVAM